MNPFFSKLRFWVIFFFGALSFFAFLPDAVAEEYVTLEWDPSISVNVIGYRLYGRDFEKEYTDANGKLYEGPELDRTCTVMVKSDRNTAFVATAFDGLNNESGYSNEVVFIPVVSAPEKPIISIRRMDGS